MLEVRWHCSELPGEVLVMIKVSSLTKPSYKCLYYVISMRLGIDDEFLSCRREVWPDRPEFGQEGISVEEEFMALREIFMTNLPS